MRGRYPSGPEAVDRLNGSEGARQRLRVLLEVLSGRCRVKDACERLGLREARLDQLRRRALLGALRALEPRPGGRPRRRREGTADRAEQLAARVRALELALRVAQARVEVAEIRAGAASATKRPARRRSQKRAGSPADEEPPGFPGEAAPGAAPTHDLDLAAGAAPRVVTCAAAPGAAPPRRPRGHRGVRGWARQRPWRQAEVAARDRVVAAADWAREHGWQTSAVAARVGLSARSLRRWSQGGARLVARGRPVVRPAAAVRQEVITHLAEWGPRVSVARLRAAFPNVPRAELADLRGRYRRIVRDRRRGRLARLTWTRAGTVWAADFTWPPAAIEGRYARLLSVRDLASGLQLAWQPVVAETAAWVAGVLTGLFREHGAPLVLKVDNGAAFDSQELQRVLSHHGVEVLYSPKATPQYNGAAEAGVGAMKGRTEVQALLRGAPGSWTWDDTEAARREANEAGVGRRETSPTREEAWAARPRLDAEARAAFRAEVDRRRGGTAPALPVEAEPSGGEGSDKACPWRVVLRRALVALGYLVLNWRRIPLQVKPQKTDNIT
jgi:transposase InsO family protein